MRDCYLCPCPYERGQMTIGSMNRPVHQCCLREHEDDQRLAIQASRPYWPDGVDSRGY